MTSTTPFIKSECEDGRHIIYTIKTDATWDAVNKCLEDFYGKDGTDLHWRWRGFGEEGKPNFQVIVSRMRCNPNICKCETCSYCQVYYTCEKKGRRYCCRTCMPINFNVECK